MRYVEARLDEENREEAYRIYVTTSLQLLPQSKHLTISYTEMLKPKEQVKEKSGDEIVMEVMKNAGLKFGG